MRISQRPRWQAYATLLEVTAILENGQRARQQQFISQKQLEMLVAMHNEATAAGATRRHIWYMFVDDDLRLCTWIVSSSSSAS